VIHRLHQALRSATLFACSTALLFALTSQVALRASAQSASPGRAAPPNVEATRVRADAPRRLLWLRAFDETPSELELRVERALGRALAELGFLLNRSPTPFREAQLATGCVGGLRECGARVAAALESEQLAISALERRAPEASTATFALYRFEGAQLVGSGSALLPLKAAEELELTVRALAESVFGPSRPTSPSGPAAPVARAVTSPAAVSATVALSRARSEPRERDGAPALRGVGWTALALGGAGAIGAVATAVSARHETEAYRSASLATSGDVDRALQHYERAEDRASIARVLGGVSAGMVAAGTFMVLWERFAMRRDRNLHSSPADQAGIRPRTGIRASAWPQRTGVTLALGVEL
jgi:hypothetical protein